MRKHLIIATRGSALALWQANYIKSRIMALEPAINISLSVIKTTGDKIQDAPLASIGGKGLFVKEIEEALLEGKADLAVHSIKDLPMVLPENLLIGCIPKRDACTDCFLSQRFQSIEALPLKAVVGTSSLRRKAQLLALRPDLRIENLRGNIDTRLNKLMNGVYDAIILSTAGLLRLELDARFMIPLDVDTMLPAVGQGALGIECLEDNYDLLVMLANLEDRETRVCVEAERSFLATLDGGCQVPIAAYAQMIDEENILLRGLVAEVDGSLILKAQNDAHAADAEKLGANLAYELLEGGARPILQKLYSSK